MRQRRPSAAPRPAPARRPVLLAALGVAAVAALLSANTLANGFVYDDRFQIVGNRWLSDPSTLARAFVTNVWAFEGGTSNYYRPLMHVSYVLTHALAGKAAWAFHLVNLLLHAATSALALLAARRALLAGGLGERDALLGGAAAGLLFAAHPIHAEVVAWAACVPELLVALLALAAILLHARGMSRARAGAAACFLAGLFAKETMIVVPLVLAAWDLAFERPLPRPAAWVRRHAPYALALLPYLALRFTAISEVTPMRRHTALGTLEYVLNAFPLLGQHLAALVLPVEQSAFHVFHPVGSPLAPRALAGFAVAIALAAALALSLRRAPAAFFGLACVLLPILPVLYIPALGENTFAERYLYLPSFGFALLVALGAVAAAARWPGAARPVAAAVAALAVAYGAGTVARNRVWRDDLSLWTDTVAKSPDSAYARNELGVALVEKGDLAGGIAQYEEALRLDPRKALTWNNLGVALHRTGRLDLAESRLLGALALKPGYPEALANLANVYAATGRLDEAVARLREAVAAEPASTELRIALGNALDARGARDEAMAEYLAALAADPANADAHLHVGIALAERGRLGEALPRLEAAARLAPDDEVVRHNLAQAYRLAGQGARADALLRGAAAP
jgi:Flp pilus assembly protein TadD